MNCRTARKRMQMRLDAALPEHEDATYRTHLQRCPACAERAREHDLLRAWLAGAGAEEPSAQFDWRLRLRLARAAEEGAALDAPRRRVWSTPLQFAAAAATAVVVVLGVGAVVLRSPASPGSSPTAAGRQDATTPGRVASSPPGGASVIQVRRPLPQGVEAGAADAAGAPQDTLLPQAEAAAPR